MSELPIPGWSIPEFVPGSVWLVGAGPSDPGLLTILGWEGLRQADAIVYDALVDPRLLGIARAGIEIVFAGKRGGKPSPKQADISAEIVRLAREGKRVLRLKGGDPLVFGRGGEEALALVAAGIPFRFVPGITAGTGGLAYAGIPLTHRGLNQTVTFVTGHAGGGEVPEQLNWRALAEGSPMLVFYMAVTHAADIAANLLAHGREPAEPAAIVVRATTPEQRVIETTLGDLAETVARSGVEAPALIVVGKNVLLRHELGWLA